MSGTYIKVYNCAIFLERLTVFSLAYPVHLWQLSLKFFLNYNWFAKEVKSSLTANKMEQNDGKTDFLILSTAGHNKHIQFDDINICDAQVYSSNNARHLGIIFDKDMSLKTQINNICKLGYYQIRNLSAIRNVLDMESAKAAANAFISSTLDYGNSLLYMDYLGIN